MPSRRVPDLRTQPISEVAVFQDSRCQAIAALFAHAEKTALDAIDWYLGRRRFYAYCSRALRAMAALCVIAGSLLPLIDSATPHTVNPQWGFVLIGLSAGCILFDRVFGFSASWSRFMGCQVQLQRILAEAYIIWQQTCSEIDTESPTSHDRQLLIAIAANLLRGVRATIEEETRAWTGYLAEGLEELTRSSGGHAGSAEKQSPRPQEFSPLPAPRPGGQPPPASR
ncbi:MAG: SLATT domain-containing protein [Streptomyces sp.]|jgi:SMODS and SLOG-associating 2TM effector domain 2|uniref:SLATT domain-containing protein n=1 Tax=Streptomyces sp. TaxID=1931 RepID=UPI0025DD8297|nr:SLATT domain-containing protein [Streptomyces sp.]MBW8798894.1 SLATT domain-containing protein [Streptomyces sp.]